MSDAAIFWVVLGAAALLAVVGFLADWLNEGAALGMLVLLAALAWGRQRGR